MNHPGVSRDVSKETKLKLMVKFETLHLLNMALGLPFVGLVSLRPVLALLKFHTG